MRVLTRSGGVTTEHQIPSTVVALVHEQGIKVSAPDARTITPEDTLRCMREMTQREWAYISTGPVFPHFFGMLFPGHDPLPTSIETFLEDSDEGILHGAGLIVLLCEAMFVQCPSVFLKTPEAYLHPRQQAHLMTVILAIRRLSGVGSNPSSVSLGD